MGKIRVATLGDEDQEKELKRKADARRETKKSKKSVENLDEGLGERGRNTLCGRIPRRR